MMKLIATARRIGGHLVDYWYSRDGRIYFVARFDSTGEVFEEHWDDNLAGFRYGLCNEELYDVRIW